MSDPTHVTVLFEGPLRFGSVEKKIPTFSDETDNISEVPSTDTSVIKNELQQFMPVYKFTKDIHLPCP